MDILKDRYTITELSDELELTDHALRYYEKEFSLKVPRDERGRRYYTTELANIMYQIKEMRKEGLQIKAIKKILESEELIEPPPVVAEDERDSISLTIHENSSPVKYPLDIRAFFEEFKNQISECVSNEVSSIKHHFSEEITKSKLELGACVENSARKLESKLDEHFREVDELISNWRKKNKRKPFYNFIKIFK